MCRYNRRETTATLRHLNLDVRGKAPELAARLFEATAEARKAYDLKMKRSKAREAASAGAAAPVATAGKGRGRGRDDHGPSGKGRGRTGGKGAPRTALATATKGTVAPGPAGGDAAVAPAAGQGRGKGREGRARGSGKGRGRSGGKGVASSTRAEPVSAPGNGRGRGRSDFSHGAAKRAAPSASISPGQHEPPKSRRTQPDTEAPKRPRGSPLGSSPILSPPLRKTKTAEGSKPKGPRCLFASKRVQVEEAPLTTDDRPSSDDELPLAHRAFQRVQANAVQDESDDSSDEDDIPLAHRVLPTDYTFDMLTVQPKTFAVTAAGGNDPADECSFTFPLARGKLSLPMHYVEVLELDPVKRMVHWQFWIPRAGHLTATSKNTKRTFKQRELLFLPEAFRRGGQRHRGWHPFSPDEVLTCWDERQNPPAGGIPGGEEKEEFLKVVADNTE